jgi:hypothetical protein
MNLIWFSLNCFGNLGIIYAIIIIVQTFVHAKDVLVCLQCEFV